MSDHEGDDEVHALVWVCPLCDAAVIDELQLAAARDAGEAPEQTAATALEQHIDDHVEQMIAAVEHRCTYVGARGVRCTLPPHDTRMLHCPGRLLDDAVRTVTGADDDDVLSHAECCGCKQLPG